ncbi:MAG: dTDP-4-dehydrorhamnose 3,5-epimerase [Victivallaceae bacterium]|nr:dTDP-4-dehydrorhamnose 3,5-epimerase [Victivallaceae bacterium]
MNVVKTEIEGVIIVEPRVFGDRRGYFLETYNREKYAEIGIDCDFVQDNESFSTKGVVRGLHFQVPPHTQAKLVHVMQGTVIDVAVDIRLGSPTFGRHVAVELSGENKRQLLIPRGMAHGFAVISDTALFSYKCDNSYCVPSERCIRFDDPDIDIKWPVPVSEMTLSPKDLNGVFLKDAELFERY